MIFLIFILLFINICFAYTESDTRGSIYMKLRVRQHGRIYIDGKAEKVVANITLPFNAKIEEVDKNWKIVRDNLGNKIIEITGRPDSNNIFEFNIISTVVSNSIETNDIKDMKNTPSDVEIFTNPTEHIQSNNSNIRELAINLTKNVKNSFERIASLAIWVNRNLRYNLAYSNKNYDAVTVLKKREGVCAEYTTLFIALTRAIGIPARYVSSYAFGKNGWEPHAYAEVWLGSWVPVDPLWFQIGYLDASHTVSYTHLTLPTKA